MAGSNEEGNAAGGDVAINALTRDACRMEMIQSEYSSLIVAVLGIQWRLSSWRPSDATRETRFDGRRAIPDSD